MAVRYAVANGNWSNTATWDGGTFPTASDDVYADGKTVTIDQNVTVLSIRNQQRAGGTNGGTFSIPSGNHNIIADGYASTNNFITITGTSNPTFTGNYFLTSVVSGNTFNCNGTGTVTINGNITGTNLNLSYGISLTNGVLIVVGNITGGNSGTNGSQTLNIQNAARAEITGILTGGIVNNGQAVICSSTNSNALTLTGTCISGTASAITNASTGTVTINTSQTAAGTASVYMITNSGTGIVNINGDCLGALSSAPSTALILNNSSTGTVNISGSVTARSVSPSTTNGIVNNTGTGTINVGGNVSGGSVANTIGMGNGSTGTINVTGNITGGSNGTNTPAIYSTTAGTIDVTGSCSADAHPALWSTSTTAVNRLRGDITTKNGIVAFYAFKVNISPSAAQQFTFQDTSNVNRILATSNISPGVPSASNVRYGTIYGSLGEYTGTLRVPNPNTVLLGNLTDNTTGTLLMTPSDFWNAATSGMTTSGSIGERLKNASTVQTTGDQLASYQV